MSIIQQLRDRAAILLISLIALSLIGFLVQDAFVGGSSGLFSGPSTTAGSINGRKVDAREYSDKVRLAEEGYRSRGYPMNEMMSQNVMESIWNSYIQDELVRTECNKLGIAFTPKELGALLFSDAAPQEFKQLFTDQNTGVYNIDGARQWFANIKKSKKSEDVKAINEQLINPLVLNQMMVKYVSLVSGATYVPKWMVEKMNTDNNTFAGISFAGFPYGTMSDSLPGLKVTDAEINEYVQQHKDEYKQEKTRSISYVVFDAGPSKGDSTAILNQLEALKSDFAAAADARAFVTRNNSALPFFDGYALKSNLQMAMKDSIIALPVGKVIGPYLDGGSYVIAKKVDVMKLPDSVYCRHILIRTSGEGATPDSTAKKRIDSIAAAINAGGDFEKIMMQVSDDKEANKIPGGIMQFSSMQIQNKESFDPDFGKFILFDGKKGDRKVVKTQFGYHYIHITEQKKFEDAYKVAYLSKRIVPSPETDNAASAAATQFAANSRNIKAFDENVTKQKLNKRLADNIREMDYSAAGLPSRQFVKWIFENEPGDVSEPFDFDDKYVVAVITGAYSEGVQPAQVARPLVEPLLRNRKKAAEIIKKIGNITTLEAVASAHNLTVLKADTVRFADQFIPNLGGEPKVIGAAFYKQNLNKVSAPIEGGGGVYLIQVHNTGALPNTASPVEDQRKMLTQQIKQYVNTGTVIDALRKASTIKDNRREAGF
jgi:peptidyl-prolyl cis-trans isomerase D